MAFINKIGNILKQTPNKLPSLESSIPNASWIQACRYFSSSKLFVGGLSFVTDDNSLREAFLPYGDVIEARIIFDRNSGSSRGFGFVSFSSAEEASSAIQALDQRDLHGRSISVAYAANQRHTGHAPSFSGAAGYDDNFKRNDRYGTVASHIVGRFSGRDANYADGGYNSHGNVGFGSTEDFNDSYYSRPNVGKYEGFPANGNGGNTYPAENGLNIGPDSFRTHDVSYGARGYYLHPTGDNLEGTPEGGYGAACGGIRSESISYGTTGYFSSSDDGKGKPASNVGTISSKVKQETI